MKTNKKHTYVSSINKQHSSPKARKTILSSLMCCIFILLFASCSSLVTVHVQKFYSAKISMNIYIEDFFAQYLFDLLGATTVEEVFPEEDLRTYLRSVDAISQVDIEYKEDIKTIIINLHSNNIIATLQDFEVIDDKKIISTNMQEFTVTFSRKDLFEIISSIPKYSKNKAIVQNFFPDKNPFADNDYASYLAWALSDYGNEQTIKEQLQSSYARIEMKKEKGFGKLPDKNWKKSMAEDTQYIDYFLMDMMNQKTLELHFTF